MCQKYQKKSLFVEDSSCSTTIFSDLAERDVGEGGTMGYYLSLRYWTSYSTHTSHARCTPTSAIDQFVQVA